MVNVTERFERRQNRTRGALARRAKGRPRLSVFRSNRHIYAQIVDDARGHTLAAASTNDPQFRGEAAKTATREAAEWVGKLIAERAAAAGVTTVVFDRGAYRYHGRVKALADGARAGGLSF